MEAGVGLDWVDSFSLVLCAVVYLTDARIRVVSFVSGFLNQILHVDRREHAGACLRERLSMPCNPEELRHVPLFELLDEEELAVLASQVDIQQFAARQRIFKIGEPSTRAYIMMSGRVQVTTVDEDQQEVVIDEPEHGGLFGFASMMDQTPHWANAMAMEESVCVELDRADIAVLLERKPMAGLDMLTMLGRQLHASQRLIQLRAQRNPNELIEEESTFGERIADEVARFGGSWRFIILFAVVLVVYSGLNIVLKGRAWDPYPFILLNLFLSMLASIQAPVIMMSQNRQDTKDRLRSELDFDVNRRAESEIQTLSQKLSLVMDKVSDVEDMLREKQGR
jgi:CRP/FNR family cyclic AMP-dependent transcriptional regulator